MKLCKDCKHYRREGALPVLSLCAMNRQSYQDPVTGHKHSWYGTAIVAREGTDCGMGAKLWEPKEPSLTKRLTMKLREWANG